MCDDGGVLVETRSHASGDPGLEGERDPMRADVVGATDDIGPIPRRNDFGTYVSEVTFDKLYVHIDFKGSPPRPQYIMDCFPLFADWGATGIVFEWEDMLPFDGRLEKIRSPSCYTREEVEMIIGAAEGAGLHCIPLVQTFGHLEFVLKHQDFAAYAEVCGQLSSCICPLAEGSVPLAKELIDQTLRFHPSADTIHIGCDEVFHLGSCARCQRKVMEAGIDHLFTDYVNALLLHCKAKNVRALLWHDMLNSFAPSVLMDKIAHTGEPVLWHYGDVMHGVNESAINNLFEAFPRVWGATAFKGAAEPDAVWVPVHQRLANHISWLQKACLLKERSRYLEAIVVTGWSRFSHASALCEILPVGLPSLYVCLKLLQNGRFSVELLESAAESLGIPVWALCSDATSLDAPFPSTDDSLFPGAQAYFTFARLEAIRQFYVKTKQQQAEMGACVGGGGGCSQSSLRALKSHLSVLGKCQDTLDALKRGLTDPLDSILFKPDIDELLSTKVDRVAELVATLRGELRKELEGMDDGLVYLGHSPNNIETDDVPV